MTVRRYRVRHATHYRYDNDVPLAHNRAVLLPRRLAHQRVDRSELRIDPAPAHRDDTTDVFGNTVTSFSVEQPHRELSVVSDFEVEICTDVDRLGPGGHAPWELAADEARRLVDVDRLLCLPSPYARAGEAVAAYAAGSFPPGRPLGEAVTELTDRIHRDFAYRPGATVIGTPVDELLQRRAGVCQDFAHVQLACLRAVGLAARYVSGYLETEPPPGLPRLVGADASHAWCSVRQADGTWLDLDPTNALVGPTTHVTVAWGRDYGDVAPLAGVIFAGRVASTLTVSVDVERRPA